MHHKDAGVVTLSYVVLDLLRRIEREWLFGLRLRHRRSRVVKPA